MSILTYLKEQNRQWKDWNDFYHMRIDEYNGSIFNPTIYHDAIAILQSKNYRDWVFNTNKILSRSDIVNNIRDYIVANNLQYAIFNSHDIIEDPSLLTTYNIDLEFYKNIKQDEKFMVNYLNFCFANHHKASMNILRFANPPKESMNILRDIPIDIVWRILDTHKYSYGNDNLVKNIVTLLLTDTFEKNRESLLSLIKSSRNYMSVIIRDLFKDDIQIQKNILSEPLLVEKIFSNSDVICTLMKVDDIPPFYFDKYHDLMIKNISLLDFSHLASCHHPNIHIFFKNAIRKIDVNRSVQSSIKLQEQYIESLSHAHQLGAFKLQELTPIDKMMLYLKAETGGIEYMIWVADSASPHVEKMPTGWKYKISHLQALKQQLDDDLTELLTLNVSDWVKNTMRQASLIYSKSSDIKKFCLTSFNDTIHGSIASDEIELYL